MRGDIEKRSCDRCGVDYKKKKLTKQRGLLVCSSCIDDIKENKSISMRLSSARNNGTTTTAVNTSTIFTITAVGGITPSNSVSTNVTFGANLGITPTTTISFSNSYYMKIVGDGAINITADPQIVVGQNGDKLTIEGTSDTNYVLLEDGTGVELRNGSIYIKNKSIISLVYDTTKSKWVEVSRGEAI
jgi:hypothetical protein